MNWKLASILTTGLLAHQAIAADGKWNADAGDNWGTASRWTNSQIADGVGSAANISFNITAARTVTLNGNRTVGKIRFEDASTASHDWTLGVSGGAVLTLATSSGTPTIEVVNQTATLNPVIAGNQGFTRTGGGTLVLANAANTFSGKLSFNAGTTRITAGGSLGPEPAAFEPDNITLNGGALMNNSSEPVIPANRGITIGASGGTITAGWSRSITINSPITGTGTLTFRPDVTPGPMILNAVNTHSGPMLISANSAGSWAIVEVNGSVASSYVQINTNGVLSGTGTVDSPVWTTTNGIVSPGKLYTAGTLTVNNNVSLTNAFLAYDLAAIAEAGGANDLLQVNGNLTLQGLITVTLNPLNGNLATGKYRLINYTGALDLSGATLVCDNPRFNATFDTATPNEINVTIANAIGANLTWVGNLSTNWDVAITENFANGANADKFYHGDAVTIDDTGTTDNGTIWLAAPIGNIRTLLPSSLTVDSTNTLTITSSTASRFGGAMSFFKKGSGLLNWNLGNANQPNLYEGPTVISEGTVKINTWRALGGTNANASITITNTGRLDLNGQGNVWKPVLVQGAGPDGAGAIYNSGAATANDGLRAGVTLLGDTTIGGIGRSDIFGNQMLGNGFKLTKSGPNEMALANLGDTGLGEIEVNGGVLTFLGNSMPGNASDAVTVRSNAIFNFWALNNSAATPFSKPLNLTNGVFRSASGNNYHSGAITLGGDTNVINVSGQLTTTSPIQGPAVLQRTGAGTLILEGPATHTGATLLDAGTNVLTASATVGATPLIALASPAVLDVTQAPLTLGSSQTLAGSGIVKGDVTTQPGATIVPGLTATPATLTFSGSLNLDSAVLPVQLGANPSVAAASDLIKANGVTANGVTTINVNPLAALDTATPYTIIANTGAAMASGTEAKFNVTTDSRYNFTVEPADLSSGAALQIKVAGTGTSALLTWLGSDATSPTLWDLKATANWSNDGVADKFFAGDGVVFDDTAVGNTANVAGSVAPASLVLSNATKAFTIGGSGSIVTPSILNYGSGITTFADALGVTLIGGLTNASGTLVFANEAVNNFGAVNVTGGSLRLENDSVNTLSALNLAGGEMVLKQNIPTTLPLAIAGAGTLRKQGTNVLSLSGASSGFNGAIVVEEGVLRAANAAALGSVTGATTVNPGAALDVNGQGLGFEPIIASGAGPNGAGAINNFGGDNQNATRLVTLAGDTTFGASNGRWDIRSDSTTAANAKLLTGGQPYNLTKVGPRDMGLVSVQVDPALGNIDVKEGQFIYEALSTGLGDPTKTMTIYSNAAFRMWAVTSGPVMKNVVVHDGGRFSGGSGTANAIGGPVDILDGSAIFDIASGVAINLTNTVSGDGGIVKSNTGTLFLSGENTFTGNITNYGGALSISNSLALGTNKVVAVNYTTATPGGNGTQLILRGNITTPPDVIGSFTGTTNGGDFRTSLISQVAPNTWQGPLFLNGSAIVGFLGTVASPLTIDGPIIGTNGFTGTAFFRGASGFMGTVRTPINLPEGIVAFTDGAAWQFNTPTNVWASTRIVFGRAILGANNAISMFANAHFGQPGNSGALDLNGYVQIVPSLTVQPGTTGHQIGSSSTTADSTFVFDGTTNASVFEAGAIVDSVSGGTRKVEVKIESGSLQLNGNNTYSGATTINGRLALGAAASLANTPVITLGATGDLDVSAQSAGWTLAAGQTLTGSGKVTGSLTAGSGSTVASGIGIGALSVTGTLTLGAGAVAVFEVNSGATPSSDVITAAAITAGGTLAISNVGSAIVAGNSFKLFNGPVTGTFEAIEPAVPAAGLKWDTSSLAVDGTLKAVVGVSTVPTAVAASVSAGELTLSWPSDHMGWRLEAQTNSSSIGLSDNWVAVPGSSETNSATIKIDPAAGAVFYRLVYP